MGAVVAITGSMGAGKSTVVRHLVGLLQRAVAVHEDDHQSMTLWSADEMRRWQEAGADVGQLPLEDLPALLATLRDAERGHRGIVVLESQFGRLHPALRPLIDFQIWLTVPADLAYARRIAQLAEEHAADPASRLASIAGMTRAYIEWTAPLVHRQQATVPAVSDIVVAGDAPVSSVVDDCLNAIARFQGCD